MRAAQGLTLHSKVHFYENHGSTGGSGSGSGSDGGVKGVDPHADDIYDP
jgi:hypothetical protein